jgi:hypothetical protein
VSTIGRRARLGHRRTRLSRPVLGDLPGVPVSRLQRVGAQPLRAGDELARTAAARSCCIAQRHHPVRGHARFRIVLQAHADGASRPPRRCRSCGPCAGPSGRKPATGC